MKCPSERCGGVLNVIDSRTVQNMVRRRRTCLKCKARFTTQECIVAGKSEGALGTPTPEQFMKKKELVFK